MRIMSYSNWPVFLHWKNFQKSLSCILKHKVTSIIKQQAVLPPPSMVSQGHKLTGTRATVTHIIGCLLQYTLSPSLPESRVTDSQCQKEVRDHSARPSSSCLSSTLLTVLKAEAGGVSCHQASSCPLGPSSSVLCLHQVFPPRFGVHHPPHICEQYPHHSPLRTATSPGPEGSTHRATRVPLSPP